VAAQQWLPAALLGGFALFLGGAGPEWREESRRHLSRPSVAERCLPPTHSSRIDASHIAFSVISAVSDAATKPRAAHENEKTEVRESVLGVYLCLT
jgi:hypothetical protein